MTSTRSALTTVTRLVPPGAERLEPAPFAEIQGTLALDLRGSSGMPAIPEYDESARSRLEGPRDGEVRAWSARFAQAVVESLGGVRSASQLVRWTTAQVFADLERRSTLLNQARSRTGGRQPVIRPQVRSVHVCRPEPECAEVSVVVRHGQRSRALALRLEYRSERWVCTALELG